MSKKDKTEDGTPSTDVSQISGSLVDRAPDASKSADSVAHEILKDQPSNIDAKPGRGRKGLSDPEVKAELKRLGVHFAEETESKKLRRMLTQARRNAKGSNSKLGGLPNSEEEKQQEQKYKELGIFCAQFVFTLCSNIDPVEWKPTPAENDSTETAFERVARRYDWQDLPPVLGLVVTIFAYAVPRLHKPKTREKVAGVKKRVIDWYLKKTRK